MRNNLELTFLRNFRAFSENFRQTKINLCDICAGKKN